MIESDLICRGVDVSKPLAIITGGSRGLGFATAEGLAAKGFRVVLIGRDPERVASAATLINEKFPSADLAGDGTVLPTAFGEGIDFEATTIEKMNQVGNRLSEIVRKYEKDSGLPKVLIIGHGVMSAKMSKTLKSDASEWRRVMSTNLDSVFTIVNVIGQEMANVRDGRIVIYSACLGRMSGPGNTGGLAPYRISKSGVNALVRNLAHETGLGSRGLLVDAICPNHSRTDMGGADAPRSAEEGAQTAIWLATRAFTPGTDQTGLLWEDNQIVPW